jgi:ribosomal-protein-alanine N-acetyltransferase
LLIAYLDLKPGTPYYFGAAARNARRPAGLQSLCVTVLQTKRLVLRRLDAEDAPFILELVNEPSWLRFIGDKGVRTLDDARGYIASGPARSYARHGFGLYLVVLKATGAPLGLCGLIKRDALSDVDLGFAFVPRHFRQGYALEAARATLEYARQALGLPRVVAITTPDNEASIKLLERLGMRATETVCLPGDPAPLRLFST